MPQDADGSGLVSLIWTALIYWNIYWWLAHLPPEQAEQDGHRNDQLNVPGNAGTLSGSAGPVPSRLGALVLEVLRRDGGTRIEDFLGQRLAAYEATIAAFDAGDRNTLGKLVSPEVFDVFSEAIEAREAQRHEIETVFSQIDPPEIVDGLIDETHMEVSVRFAGECFKLCRNATGRPTDQPPDRCHSIDIWTFGRMLSSHERAWRVLATEAGVQ